MEAEPQHKSKKKVWTMQTTQLVDLLHAKAVLFHVGMGLCDIHAWDHSSQCGFWRRALWHRALVYMWGAPGQIQLKASLRLGFVLHRRCAKLCKITFCKRPNRRRVGQILLFHTVYGKTVRSFPKTSGLLPKTVEKAAGPSTIIFHHCPLFQ